MDWLFDLIEGGIRLIKNYRKASAAEEAEALRLMRSRLLTGVAHIDTRLAELDAVQAETDRVIEDAAPKE